MSSDETLAIKAYFIKKCNLWKCDVNELMKREKYSKVCKSAKISTIAALPSRLLCPKKRKIIKWCLNTQNFLCLEKEFL